MKNTLYDICINSLNREAPNSWSEGQIVVASYGCPTQPLILWRNNIVHIINKLKLKNNFKINIPS